MNPRFKQLGPKDQLTVMVMSLEGHLANLEDGIIDQKQFLERTNQFLKDIKDLKPYLPNQWNKT
jgi:hypothetical protein